MSVLLIPNPTKDTGLAVTRQAAAVLAGRGIPVLMPQAFAAADGLDGVRFLPEEQAYRAAEQVVTIGGIVGIVCAIADKDDTLVIETGSDRTKIRFRRSAISSVEKLDTGKDSKSAPVKK